ncbi:MAG TPA: hypothetical protein VGC46_10400 [Allosphingosinicella sp.]
MNVRHTVALGAALLCVPGLAHAQDAAAPVQPAVATTAEAAAPAEVFVPITPAPVAPATATIAAGLSIPLSLNAELSSSRNREGETFAMTVAQDVLSDGIVVIPRGTRAVGEITLRSGRGMFGKSGKMELSFRYLDMDGVRVPLDGTHFQAGEGNTAGTVGAVLAAGVVGGMVVTGRSANMPEGREFTAQTLDALPVTVLPPAAGSYDRPQARLAAHYTPSPIQTGSAHRMAEERRAQEAREARRRRR